MQKSTISDFDNKKSLKIKPYALKQLKSVESYKPKDIVFGHPNTIDLRKKNKKTVDDPFNHPFKLTSHKKKISKIFDLSAETDF